MARVEYFDVATGQDVSVTVTRPLPAHNVPTADEIYAAQLQTSSDEDWKGQVLMLLQSIDATLQLMLATMEDDAGG